jgi:hypothetical protein
MDMPGFTAETSLYQTNNHYRSAGGSFPNNGNTAVTPQACGFFDALFCGTFVAAVSGVCLGVCIAGIPTGPLGAAACLACAVGVVGGSILTACHDCLPGVIRQQIDIAMSQGGSTGGGGGGGGGGSTGGPCGCPPNTKCCGECVKLPGQGLFCDGDCVPRNAACP